MSAVRDPLLPSKDARPGRRGVPATESSKRLLAVEPVRSGIIQVAGNDVDVWNDAHFSQLRQLHGVPDDFVSNPAVCKGCSSFDLNKPRTESAFGKGGNAQYMSECRNYICKSLALCDHVSLLKRTESYIQRMLTGDSLLVPIYLHFRDPTTQLCYIVMKNLTPFAGAWEAKYDLKGCDDDKTLEKGGSIVRPVRRRWYHVHRWCSCAWTPARWTYYRGKVEARQLKFSFPMETRDEVLRQLRGDVDWLIEQGLMDYSLFLAVRSMPASSIMDNGQVDPKWSANGSMASKQYAMKNDSEGTVVVVALGIIDFLQPWTASKKVAQCIKSLEFNKATVPPPKYGKRFARHFTERFTTDGGLVALGRLKLE